MKGIDEVTPLLQCSAALERKLHVEIELQLSVEPGEVDWLRGRGIIVFLPKEEIPQAAFPREFTFSVNK